MKKWLSQVLTSVFCLAAGGVMAGEKLTVGSEGLSQLEVVSSMNNFTPSDNDFRIYFAGNSITRHGFDRNTIKNLKWDHLSGMAASQESKDYAHLLASSIQNTMPDKKVRLFFGRGSNPAGALKGINDVVKFQPQLIIVQMGEHVKLDAVEEDVSQDYSAMLDAFLKIEPKPLIICVGVWEPLKGVEAYCGRVEMIDRVQGGVCKSRGIPYVSVEKYALDPQCSGTGGSDGVRWHPNDNGQAGYAKEIFACFQAANAPAKSEK